MKVRAL
jgi:hypothetical protein